MGPAGRPVSFLLARGGSGVGGASAVDISLYPMGSKSADRKQAKKSYLQYHRVCPLESGVEVEELSLAPANLKPGQSWSDLPHPLLETIFSYANEDQSGLQDPRVSQRSETPCVSGLALAPLS